MPPALSHFCLTSTVFITHAFAMLIASPKVLSRTRLPLAPGSRQRFRSYASTPGSASKIVPLWIDGRPESSSSAGTVQTRHAKTLEPASEVVVAGEVET